MSGILFRLIVMSMKATTAEIVGIKVMVDKRDETTPSVLFSILLTNTSQPTSKLRPSF